MPIPDLRLLARAAHPPDHQSLDELRTLAHRLRSIDAPDLASGLEAAVHLVEACTVRSSRLDRHALAGKARRLFELLDEPVRELTEQLSEKPAPAGAPPTEAAQRPRPPAAASGGHKLLGEILIELGHISPADVDRALEMQRKRDLPLGDCLLILGAATPDQVFAALRLQRALSGAEADPPPPPRRAPRPPARREDARPDDGRRAARSPAPGAARTPALPDMSFLGKVLMGTGWITRGQLRLAVERHNREGIRLGEALIELGFLTKDELAQALELQRNLRGMKGRGRCFEG